MTLFEQFKEIIKKKTEIMKDSTIVTVFTPNTYGWLPQTLRGKDFFNFRQDRKSVV